MIYPTNFEDKIGFSEVRQLLKAQCLSTLGKERVDELGFNADSDTINQWMQQTREFRRIEESQEDFPLDNFFDMRESLVRIRLENTHMEEDELFDLRRSLHTIGLIVAFLSRSMEQDETPTDIPSEYAEYPALYALADGVGTFPNLITHIDRILDKFGHLRDNASPALLNIRHELAHIEGSVSKTLYGILRAAQSEGVVDKDIAPTLRDGRLVIPVLPTMKRKIKGIVHDTSASGRTVFIEPAEVVEANNRIRELENDERQEMIRILTEVTKQIRPYARELQDAYRFLGTIDLIHAKAALARQMKAFEPVVEQEPVVDWIQAVHPLLRITLERQQKRVVPLDITLKPEKRMLIISGPNAGGKSVCLKTVGLLQYMLQCGLSIPVGERSRAGVFQHLMIDIGDEQSMENDLSTYSSHLVNMKNMMRQAGPHTIILIDEFGTGTEPQIGGAIAESVLNHLCTDGTWGVITTHYQNLKHFADTHDTVANGAMLYDRHQMRPLFQLAIGRPGSSFAIEIARQTGLPEDVIREASEIVGSDYIQSDKYLQDIVRDKRYWEGKRQTIHQREKDMEKTILRYEDNITEIERQRKEILREAKAKAAELLGEANRRIENTIREIRETQAEKEKTKRIRQELKHFEENVGELDTKANDDMIARKIEQIKQRKSRKEQHKKERAAQQAHAAETLRNAVDKRQSATATQPFAVGNTVRIKGLQTIGQIESIDGAWCTAIFGGMRSKLKSDRLEHARPVVEATKSQNNRVMESLADDMSRQTRNTIDNRRKNFHQDLDVRGMRGDEALNAVQYFIDDAILVGMGRVRILHGKGNGILRQLIRQYLGTVPNVVHFADEHVQFGGAGITVVDL